MAWFGPRGDCGCCGDPVVDCGCWGDIGESPVLMIELNLAESWETYGTCIASPEGGVYCRPAQALYGVGLQGTVAVPMKRICDGGLSRLVFDIEETYRPISGMAEYWDRDTGFSTCRPFLHRSDEPYWVEVRKDTTEVHVGLGGERWIIYPEMACQRSGSRKIPGMPETWIPPEPSQPGECTGSITSDERLGSCSWEIVPGA